LKSIVAFHVPAGSPVRLSVQVPLAVLMTLWVIASELSGGLAKVGTMVAVTPPVTTGDRFWRMTSTCIVTGRSVLADTSWLTFVESGSFMGKKSPGCGVQIPLVRARKASDPPRKTFRSSLELKTPYLLPIPHEVNCHNDH
jgi:hypothetical protein